MAKSEPFSSARRKPLTLSLPSQAVIADGYMKELKGK